MNRSLSPPVHLHVAQGNSRSVSPPVHLHVGKKTPVHLHIKPGKKRVSRLERQQLSCSEMSAGRPSVRASGSFSASQYSNSSNWLSLSASKTPWVPPPGKTTQKHAMAWEGQTHRLEIHPDPSGTMLHISDLSGDEGSTEILLESSDGYQKKVDCLRAEMNHLKAEVDLQKSLRELEEKENALKDSMSSLRLKEAELSHCQDEFLQPEKFKPRLSHSPSPKRPRSALDAEDNRKRERLMAQLAEVETEGMSVMRHANKLKSSVKKLQKDRRFVSVHAAQVSENKDVFLTSLSQFETSNKLLSKMIQVQQTHQASVGHLAQERDLLGQRLSVSDSTNQILRERLEEQGKMAMHTQNLHDEIGQREGQLHTLDIRLQSLEEQLHHRDLECSQLQSELCEVKKHYHRDKEVLKKATKQHKDRAVHSERTLETVGTQLEEANTEFSRIKTRLAKSIQEVLSHEAEITGLRTKIHELESCLSQTRITSKVSLDAVSSQLSEKTHELKCVRNEMDRFKAMIASLEAQQRATESGYLVKISSLESEMSQMNSSMTHNHEMVLEYKAQLDRSRTQCEELTREIRAKEQDTDQLKRESMLEAEKYRLKYQQQLTDLEPMPEMLKTSEQRLSDTQERLISHEQRCGEQTRLIAELSLKAEQNATIMESLKGKLHEAMADRRAQEGQLAMTEQKRQEAEQQNRELIGISGRKEEMVQRLQCRVEEVVQEMATQSAQLDASKAESRRYAEQIKDRASNKERTNLTRISDLETQLTRANSLATQFRKSKDDLERRYHSRVHELQDRLEQANSTKRSLENYITFLKSSYASVFTDSHSLHVPGSPVSPLTH